MKPCTRSAARFNMSALMTARLLFACEPVVAGHVLHESICPPRRLSELDAETVQAGKPGFGFAVSGTFPRPSMSANSVSPETAISTPVGRVSKVSAAPRRCRRTSPESRGRPLPRTCFRRRPCPPSARDQLPFSLQTHSIISVSAASSARTETVQGLVYRRVGERHVEVQIAEVAAPVPFGHAQRLGVGMAIVIQPGTVIEAVTLHHQRVAVPVAHRVTHPTRIGRGSPMRGRP